MLSRFNSVAAGPSGRVFLGGWQQCYVGYIDYILPQLLNSILYKIWVEFQNYHLVYTYNGLNYQLIQIKKCMKEEHGGCEMNTIVSLSKDL
jgi:hypothetical protein